MTDKTQRRSPAVLELIDKDGNSVMTGSVGALADMERYARAKWPDQDGWSIREVVNG